MTCQAKGHTPSGSRFPPQRKRILCGIITGRVSEMIETKMCKMCEGEGVVGNEEMIVCPKCEGYGFFYFDEEGNPIEGEKNGKY